MINYLVIKTNKNIHFVVIEVDGHLLRLITGKSQIESSKRISHCGTSEKALLAAKELVHRYELEGYQKVSFLEGYYDDVIDNGQWHLSSDFPKDLSAHQAYVHTGMFVGWLIENNFFTKEFCEDNTVSIKEFLSRKISGPTFFKQDMDGKFTLGLLCDKIKPFVIFYYN